MKNLQHKPIGLELKDLDTNKRTAIIAHAVYNVVDRCGDISCKGMFDKTWKENKSIDFLFNHDPEQVVGSVLRTFDDEEKAYTEVKFGPWTLGNDVLEMADMGVLKGASFGYNTEKKEFVTIKGKKVRKLKEVFHGETSLLTKMPANPLAGVVKLTKAFDQIPEFKSLSAGEQAVLKQILASDQDGLEKLMQLWMSLDATSDMYTSIGYALRQRIDLINEVRWSLKYNANELKEVHDHIGRMENFVRNAKASDETIVFVQNEITEAKEILSDYDTASTQPITEPDASKNELNVFADSLYLLTLKSF